MYFDKKTPAETAETQDTSDISDIINTENKNESEIENNLPAPDQSSEDDKLSGAKLLVLGYALCFMVFLIALNGTVVATVRRPNTSRLGYV